MKKAALESKDLLNPSETIKHFDLSARRFYKLLGEKANNDFIVFYGSRKLIIRTAFEQYLLAHPELRRCR